MPFLHGTTTSNRHRLTVYQLRASVNAPDGRENALHRVVGIVLRISQKPSISVLRMRRNNTKVLNTKPAKVAVNASRFPNACSGRCDSGSPTGTASSGFTTSP